MTERRMKKFLKRLVGRTDVEDALLWLDSLTKEESLMTMAKNLEVTQHVDHNVKEIKVLAESTEDRVQVIDQTVKVVEERTDVLQRNQSKRILRHGSLLLTPPSTIRMHVRLNTREPQHGLFRIPNSKNGRKMALYCGLVAIRVPGRLYFALPSSRTSRTCPKNGPP